MVAGSDRSYLRSFGLSHNPAVFPLRVPRFFLSNASFSYPVNLLFLPCIPVFLLFTPYSPQIGPHRKRIATSRFSSVFPPFSLKCPIFALFLSNNAKVTYFRKLFFRNIWRVLKNTVPLHPLFRTKHTPRKGEQ